MSKTVNKVQLELLLQYMQENPDLATNFTKQNKDKVAAFWKRAETQLNSAGPPEKSIAEWKKVWMGQKRYVRKKAAMNFANLKATGGGPNKEIKLSPLEESIFQLTSTKVAVEGVESGRCFGFLKPAVNKENVNLDSNNESEERILQPEATVDNCEENQENRKRPRNTWMIDLAEEENRNKRTKQTTTSELIQKELEVGTAIELFREQNSEMQESLKKIYRSLNRLSENQKSQLKDMKRHNYEMEKLRKAEVQSKLERNRLITEIEEMKFRSSQYQKN